MKKMLSILLALFFCVSTGCMDQRFVSADKDGSIIVWDFNSGKKIKEIKKLKGIKGESLRIKDISQCGRYLACITNQIRTGGYKINEYLSILDLKKNEIIFDSFIWGQLGFVCFIKSKPNLISFFNGKSGSSGLQIVNFKTKKTIISSFNDFRNGYLNPNNSKIILCKKPQESLKIFDVYSSKLIKEIIPTEKNNLNHLKVVVFSPKKKHKNLFLFYWDLGFSLFVFDLEKEKIVKKLDMSECICVCNFSLDGDILVVRGEDEVKIWNTNNWKLEYSFEIDEKWKFYNKKLISDDGKYLLGLGDNKIALFELQKNKKIEKEKNIENKGYIKSFFNMFTSFESSKVLLSTKDIEEKKPLRIFEHNAVRSAMFIPLSAVYKEYKKVLFQKQKDNVLSDMVIHTN